MSKIIFICYEHGTGGEGLSVAISRLPFCVDLRYENQGDRTWTYDYFNKLFLKNFDPEWKNKLPTLPREANYIVVPSHYRPEVLKEVFPTALYVVINSPYTKLSKYHLINRIFKQVWSTSHNTLEQRIGYFIQNAGGTKPDRQQLKELDKNISNGEIQCLINRVDPNPTNIKMLFDRWSDRYEACFKYDNDDHIVTVTYEDLQEGKTQKVMEWLTKAVDNFNHGAYVITE